MSTNINNPAYSVLNTYAVLASSGITTINTTTITNGVYGTPSATGIIGTFIGTLDGTNGTTAQTQLTNLVIAINGVSVTGPPISGGNGIITYIPGRYNSSSTIIYTSGTMIVLDAQGDSSASFFFTAGSGITFDSVASITLINGASNCNVFWLAGTAIGFTGTLPISIPGIFIAGSTISFDNASNILGRLYAQTADITFSGISFVNAICSQNIVCYRKGTLILTEQGLLPIENIIEGDMVITKGKIYNYEFIKKNAKLQMEPIIWISKFKVIDLNIQSRPICIQKNAFDINCPFQDLFVSPEHSLILNDYMVLASSMINGNTIYQDTECTNAEYYHLECNDHCAIFANGVLAESYFDADNRYVFEKKHETFIINI